MIALPNGCQAQCRACAHRSLSVAESLQQKNSWLGKELACWQDLLRPALGVPEQARWHYRQKVALNARYIDGAWQFGFIARHDKSLIAIPECPVHHNCVNDALKLLRGALPDPAAFPLAIYVQTGRQISLILKSNQLPDNQWLTADITYGLKCLGIDGLWLNLHPSAGRRLFAKRGWHRLWGQATSVNELGLLHGPSAFQQLIPQLYLQSLQQAAEFLAPGEGDSVVDLYCGTGGSLRCWTRTGAHTLGIESSAEAVAMAACNAPDALVLRGNCAQRIPQLNEWLQEQGSARTLVYVNPPRTGLEQEILHWLLQDALPARIAYLSCSVGTLRRDMEVLESNGYKTIRIQPFDFFPNTYHIENLALLQRTTDC